MPFKYAWYGLVGSLWLLAFFGFVQPPKDWVEAVELIKTIDQWILSNAAYPSLFALTTGLLFGTVIVPEAFRLFKSCYFPPKPVADIDANAAYDLILRRSKWAKNHARNWKNMQKTMYEKGRPEAEVIESRLSGTFNTEIHRALRNSEIGAWGNESMAATAADLSPQKPIDPKEWDTMQISFTNGPSGHAVRTRSFAQDGSLAFVGLHFNKKQILKAYPSAWRARTAYVKPFRS